MAEPMSSDGDVRLRDLVLGWLRNNHQPMTPLHSIFALVTFLRLHGFGEISLDKISERLRDDT